MRRICLVLLLSLTIFGDAYLECFAKNPRPAGRWQKFGPWTSECPVCKNVLSYWNDPISTLNRNVEITGDGIKISYTTKDSLRVLEAEMVCEATHKTWKTFKRIKPENSAANLCPLCKKISSLVKSGAKITVRKINEGCLVTVASVEEQNNHPKISMKEIIDSLSEKTSTFDTVFEAISIRSSRSDSIINPPGARKVEIVGDAVPGKYTSPPSAYPRESEESISTQATHEEYLEAGYANRVEGETLVTLLRCDEEPTILQKVVAKYPAIAYDNRIEGKVVLAILVDTLGHVENVKILRSSNEIFNEVAIEAAKQWLFKPSVHNKKHVKFWYMAPITFNFKEGVK